jgi:LPXTG-motif cell wall-anchored protein
MKFMDKRNQAVPEDPSGIEEPHDVLAAEEFGIGVRDERLPPDPSGIHEPHDVLAAEEFAMPAGEDAHGRSGSEPRSWLPLAGAVALGLILLLLLLRRRG